ncbi:hypothetical protein [Massilibacteroides sp.]|uniref:hypothetical protein n=1 Tax=Massilibacteroides sp. TaxID=2034766 RepID=UPI00260BC95F|nr:hypothetical protein [Massilibacteroides sp.]MDD4515250.1 hypothetical protein [Massilibacteroides sp.]
MKALIFSFFCIILGYSFLFDKKEVKDSSSTQNVDAVVIDNTNSQKVFYVDSVEYYASHKTAAIFDKRTNQIF